MEITAALFFHDATLYVAELDMILYHVLGMRMPTLTMLLTLRQ